MAGARFHLSREGGIFPSKSWVIAYGVCSLILTIMAFVVNASNIRGAESPFLGFIFIAVTTAGGAYLGDIIRRICKPDAIYTKSDVASVFVEKVYWRIGPQCIGGALGLILAINLMAPTPPKSHTDVNQSKLSVLYIKTVVQHKLCDYTRDYVLTNI